MFFFALLEKERHPGDTQATPRRQPGDTQETPRRDPGDTQETSRRNPGETQEAPRGAPRGTQEDQSLKTLKMKKKWMLFEQIWQLDAQIADIHQKSYILTGFQSFLIRYIP